MAVARSHIDELPGFLAKTGSEHLGGRSAVFLVGESRETLKYRGVQAFSFG